MVLRAGIEPARLSAADFKSATATYYVTGAFLYYIIFRIKAQSLVIQNMI